MCVYAFACVPPQAGFALVCLCVVFRAYTTACKHVLCVVCVFVCHVCVLVGSGPPYSVWQGGPSVSVCACVRKCVCVAGCWYWNELERKGTGDGGGGKGGRAMNLQPGRPARSFASYLFSVRGRNSPPRQSRVAFGPSGTGGGKCSPLWPTRARGDIR